MKKILLTTTLIFLVGCSKQSESQVNNENMTQPAVAQSDVAEKVILKNMLSY
jgi:uncharacterized protein YcfL